MPPISIHKVPEAGALAPLPGWRSFLPVRISSTEGVKHLRVLWWMAAWQAMAALVVVYLLGGCLVFVFIKYERGFSSVRLADLLVPARWPAYRKASGDFHVANARAALAEGNVALALSSFRVGLGKSPANRDGRLDFARLLAASSRPDLAEIVLTEGFKWLDADPAYVRSAFGFLLQQQRDIEVCSWAGILETRPATQPEILAISRLAAASALYFRGKYDQAEDMLRRGQLTLTVEGRLLSAQIEWDRGYRSLALQQIRGLVSEVPGYGPALNQLAAWLRSIGEWDEFRRLCILRTISDPTDARPRIELLQAHRGPGDPDALRREIAATLRPPRIDETSAHAIAAFAAETGDATTARLLFSVCREREPTWEFPALFAAEAMIVAQQYRAASTFIRDLQSARAPWTGRSQSLFNSLQAIALFGAKDPAAAQLHLDAFLAQSDLRADNLLLIAQRLRTVGASAQSRALLERAVRADPLNQAALTALVVSDVEMDAVHALPAHLRSLAAKRKPSREVLERARHRLNGDLLLFSAERDLALAEAESVLAGAAQSPRL